MVEHLRDDLLRKTLSLELHYLGERESLREKGEGRGEGGGDGGGEGGGEGGGDGGGEGGGEGRGENREEGGLHGGAVLCMDSARFRITANEKRHYILHHALVVVITGVKGVLCLLAEVRVRR